MKRCLECGRGVVPGRSRCRVHGPRNPKWFGAERGYPNPYGGAHQQRRQARIKAGERCRMAQLGGCHGPLHLDHIVPLSLGGRAVPSNEQILCERHNIAKGGRNRVA